MNHTRARHVEGPLNPDQVDDFVERSWTVLHRAFPAAVARDVRRELGGRLGIDLERPEEWTSPRVWLQAPEQAVPNLFCFSTVEPGGGGTRLVEGTHLEATRLLWAARS